MSKYDYSQVKSEISGFGGGYEKACRKMVIAAVEWWDANPEANPKFHSYQNVTGLMVEDNEDAKAMSKAATDVCADYTGAMHQAAISHAMFIHVNGWDKYVQEMNARVEERTNAN